MKDWLIEENRYNPKKELLQETLFALANGYMGCRGTLEEGTLNPEIQQYYGTYAAGIFDKYNWHYQSIVNLPYLFNTQVWINNIPLKMVSKQVKNYKRYLDMHNGLLIREFTYELNKTEKLNFKITRFLSQSEQHLAVLDYQIESINFSGNIRINNILDGNISNIDFHISGYQLRDEKYYFIDDQHDKGRLSHGGYLTVRTKTTGFSVCELFKYQLTEDDQVIKVREKFHAEKLLINNSLKINIRKNRKYDFTRITGVYTSKDKVKDIRNSAECTVDQAFQKGYNSILKEHCCTWNRIWDFSDIIIDGPLKDQKNIRFNLFHVIQMGNKKNPYVNIGSRGLTSEMHYGNCFWDTEIFIMPFFIYTDPDTARALVQYRYLTLPEARKKAQALWFKGAMYPWMSSYPGKEQADYWEYANIAVHIVTDVIYGLMNYYRITGDFKFMLDYGLEMLIETARFWQSRCYYNKRINQYVINTAKGPNEYDGVVNNNTYTNWCTRWNLIQAREFVLKIRKTDPQKYNKLVKKLKFSLKELDEWSMIIKKLKINYDKKADLYIEDDTFPDKRPVDIKKLRPGKKISTEMGWTWDTIIRHQVVKQADVLLLMYLHREYFTAKQLLSAWRFYEPVTVHDSSLSYNTHSILAAELGYQKKSYDYFQETACLDIDDLMANSFLGIHAANAGGTWQCVVNGYCGMRVNEKGIEFTPYLPVLWKKVQFKIIVRNNLCAITVTKKGIKIELLRPLKKQFNNMIRIQNNRIIFK